MTLNQFEAKLETILTETLPELVETDELGNTIPAAQYRAERCSLLSQEIRRCSWAAWARPAALALANKADTAASGRPLPRFDAFVSGGKLAGAIQ